MKSMTAEVRIGSASTFRKDHSFGTRIQFGLILFFKLMAVVVFGQVPFTRSLTDIPKLDQAFAVRLGDYDNDGDLDVAIAKDRFKTVIYRNDGAGGFVEVYQTMYSLTSGITWTDVDNNGTLDLIFSGLETFQPYPGMYIYQNKGNDLFERSIRSYDDTSVQYLVSQFVDAFDVNRDGLNDLCITIDQYGYTGTSVWINNGKGSYVDSLRYNRDLVAAQNADWADYNGDGYLDMVYSSSIYQNNGDSTFIRIDLIPDWNNGSAYWVDTNDDGYLDVTLTGRIFQNMAGAGFQLVDSTQTLSGFALKGDFNNDGRLDFLRSSELFLNTGQNSFLETRVDFLDSNPSMMYDYQVDVGDIDGDGDLDIVTAGTFEAGILYNQTNPTKVPRGVPQGLQHVIINNKVKLTWDPVSNPCSTYNLYIRKGAKYVVSPGRGPDRPNQAIFNITRMGNMGETTSVEYPQGIFEDGVYEWGLQSVGCAYDASDFSTPHYFSIKQAVEPFAPADLRATSIASNQVAFEWQDNSSDETEFVLEYSVDSGFVESTRVAANATSVAAIGLTSNTVYLFRIRAVHGEVTLGSSPLLRVETTSNLPRPENLHISSQAEFRVRLAWECTAGNQTGYIVERSFGTFSDFEELGRTSDLEFLDVYSESGSNYMYRVRSYNPLEHSVATNPLLITQYVHRFDEQSLPVFTWPTRSLTWGDFDNDGDEDVFISSTGRLYRNDGNETFTELTGTGIVNPAEHESMALWGDIDNDGYLDLFVGTVKDVSGDHFAKNLLFHNLGNGTFEPIDCAITETTMPTSAANFADYDKDGDIDLFVSNMYRPIPGAPPCYIKEPSYLYRNDGNFQFTIILVPDLTTSLDDSYMPAIGDVNGDAVPDILAAKQWGLCDWPGSGIFIAKNNSFQKDSSSVISPFGPLQRGQPETSFLLGDFDNDMDLDVVALGGYINAIYQNDGHANFSNYPVPALVGYTQTMTGNWVDFDNDGDKDFIANSEGGEFNLLFQQRNLQFTPVIAGKIAYEGQQAISWVDINNDGLQDMVSYGLSAGMNYFRNQPNDNTWINVRLKGLASNSKGLGAMVYVKTKDGWQFDFMASLHNFASQNGCTLHFGLRDATVVDSLKVIWPSGTRQVLRTVSVNQTLTIEESLDPTYAYRPGNLHSTLLSTQEVKLAWSPPAGQWHDGYLLERRLDGEAFGELTMLPKEAVNFVDNTVSDTLNYTYRIRAYYGNLISEPSNSDFVQLNFPAPYGLTLTYSGNYRELHWKFKPMAPNIVKFHAEISTMGEPFARLAEADSASRSIRYNATGVRRGSSTYRVYAEFVNGLHSRNSNEASDLITGLGLNEPSTLIYPNPVSGKAYIQVQDPHEVRVYNSLGVQIAVTENSNELDCSRLPDGLYVVWIECSSGTIVTKLAIRR